MTVAHKFTFDLDLGRAPKRSKTLPEDELEHMIAAARREGYDAGKRDGLKQGQQSAEARAGDAMSAAGEKIAADAAAMLSEIDRFESAHRQEAVALAASVARKLAAHLIAREPEAELAALLAECMASLERAPHLVIRCHPDLCDRLRTIAEERAKVTGFAGRLVVMGDPDTKLGDGRLEWVDGGLVRDINAISNEINTRISAYLAARGAGQGE